MKSKMFCAMIFILKAELLFSQQLNTNAIPEEFPGYWNLSFSAGIGGNINGNDFIQTKGTGYGFCVDASYSPENIIGFFANYSSVYIEGEYTNEDYLEKMNTGKLNYSQLSFGPRLFSNNKSLFIDAGIGYNNIATSKSIGFNAGAGGKIKFSDSYGITFNGRIYSALVQSYSSKNKKPFLYYSIYVGFEMNNSTEKNSPKSKNENRLSVTAFGGKYSNNYSYNNNSAFGGELSYDISKKVSLLLNYTHSNSSSTSQETRYWNLKSEENTKFNEIYSSTENDISGGARLYLTGNKIRFFVESYMGIYMNENVYENSLTVNDTMRFNNYHSDSKNYFGMSFGTGVDFKLLYNISGIFKVDLGTYIGETNFSTVLCGLKYSF